MRPKLLFVVNHGAFFASHRLPIAIAALSHGFDVDLLTGQAGSRVMEAAATEQIERFGIRHHRARFTASGVSIFRELGGLVDVVRCMRRIAPDIVHCVSPKGILLGGVAAFLNRQRSVVFAVSGMGFAFTSSDRRGFRRRMLAFAYARVLRFLFRWASCVIVQNNDDRMLLLRLKLITEDRLLLIPGSGVNLDDLDCSLSDKERLILFAGRLLADKGAREFVEAARLLQKSAEGWRFVMAGATDYKNPSAIGEAELQRWRAEGVVELTGHVQATDALFRKAAIVCLPSYREGMPKVLLEAAAAGCAVVTTDAVGCREAIIPDQTGTLVPLYDVGALAMALLNLINDKALRESFGAEGRRLARSRFGLSVVVRQHLDLYEKLLTRKRRGDIS